MKQPKPRIGLRPGTKLSEHFGNRRDCYKVVEIDNVLGYVVNSDGGASVAWVYPIYRADVHVKAGKVWHIISSYEHGERLNGYTFGEDYEGCTFATITAQAIRALEGRASAVKQSKTRKKPRR